MPAQRPTTAAMLLVQLLLVALLAVSAAGAWASTGYHREQSVSRGLQRRMQQRQALVDARRSLSTLLGTLSLRWGGWTRWRQGRDTKVDRHGHSCFGAHARGCEK